MLLRAEEFPLCALVLLEIRVGTILKLLRNSEKIGKRGSVSMFLSAIRLIMPLFAVTHKTDYMFLCQDLLKWYYCASPAQRKIYDEFIFNQVTSNNQPIFHDYFVELSVMVTRKKVGKKHYQGINLAMEMAAANIPISNGRMTEGYDLNNTEAATTQSSRQQTHIELVSISSMDCPYYKVAIWSPAGVAPVVQGCRVGESVQCNEYLLDVQGGGKLHSLILSAITDLGRERTMNYFVEYHIKNYGELKRSDKTVNLAKINLTVDSIKAKLEQAIFLGTSTTAKDFEQVVFTKAKLVDRIQMMCLEESAKSMDKQVKIDYSVAMTISGKNKKFIVDFLVKWRSEVFETNPQLKEELTKQIKEEFDSNGRSSPAQRKTILEDTFFSLSESVHEHKRYNEAISVANV